MRRSAFLLVLLAACSPRGVPDATERAELPSGAYLKVYAMQFVESMRADGIEAGAFEISKRLETDGCYHLGVEVMRSGGSKRLVVSLRPDAGGLVLDYSTIGGEAVVDRSDAIGGGLGGWHAAAAKAAAEEEAE